MADTQSGWGVSGGAVLHTDDGGLNWFDVTPPAFASPNAPISNRVFALGPQAAWMLFPDPKGSDRGTLVATSDGGASWTPSPAPFANAWLQFLDAKLGFALADRGAAAGSEAVDLYRSMDGGRTWQKLASAGLNSTNDPQALPVGGDKTGVGFVDENTGWVSGETPISGHFYLYETGDAGKTWQQPSLPRPAGISAERMFTTYPPRFFGQNGVLPAMISGAAPGRFQWMFFTTRDGGKTWQAGAPAPSGGSYALISAQQITVWDGGEVLYATSDGGQTWQAIHPDLRLGVGSLAAISFPDPQDGWAITSQASGGALYRTADGGQTWKKVAASLSKLVRKMDCSGATSMPAGQILAVAAQPGSIVALESRSTQAGSCLVVGRSSDLGRTWQTTPLSGSGQTAGADLGPGWANGLAFTSPSVGWAFNPGLYRTLDGGASWQAVPAGEQVIGISASPAGGGSAWALGRTCQDEAHCTYQLLQMSAAGGAPAALSGPGPLDTGREDAFVGDGLGSAYVLAGDPASQERPQMVVWKTTRDHPAWQKTASPCSLTGSLALGTSGKLWLLCGGEPGAGSQGKEFYASQDGGASWQKLAWTSEPGSLDPKTAQLPIYGYTGDLIALPGGELLTAFGRSTLYRSGDGGVHWTEAIPVDQANPGGSSWSLAAGAGSLEAWAAAGTSLFHTMDGGKTWTAENAP